VFAIESPEAADRNQPQRIIYSVKSYDRFRPTPELRHAQKVAVELPPGIHRFGPSLAKRSDDCYINNSYLRISYAG
jgi:hypothetical protein